MITRHSTLTLTPVGPTGTAGIQNANEISGSFAMVDCNALLAFFPGTALLNQHRGSINSPVSNKTNILSPDLRGGNLDADFALLNAAAAGDVERDTPQVLFANSLYRWCFALLTLPPAITTASLLLMLPVTTTATPLLLWIQQRNLL